MALKAALMLLCLTGCSTCSFRVEPIDLQMDGNRLTADGLFVGIDCKELR
jgi:hypothetical protein